MRRRLLSFAAAVSFVLCITAIAAGVRSAYAWDRLNRDELTDLGANWQRAWTRIDSSAGRIDLSLLRETRGNRTQLAYLQASTSPLYWSVRRGSISMPTNNRALRFFGIFGQIERPPEGFFLRLIVPYWLLAMLFAIGPVGCWIGRFRRRTADREGGSLCPTCGYDLRATPQRCPECGRETKNPNALLADGLAQPV